jgi:hypothetical protein
MAEVIAYQHQRGTTLSDRSTNEYGNYLPTQRELPIVEVRGWLFHVTKCYRRIVRQRSA